MTMTVFEVRSIEDEDLSSRTVVRRGWQVWINRRYVTEVRKREAYDDISSEETTSSHHPPTVRSL